MPNEIVVLLNTSDSLYQTYFFTAEQHSSLLVHLKWGMHERIKSAAHLMLSVYDKTDDLENVFYLPADQREKKVWTMTGHEYTFTLKAFDYLPLPNTAYPVLLSQASLNYKSSECILHLDIKVMTLFHPCSSVFSSLLFVFS